MTGGFPPPLGQGAADTHAAPGSRRRPSGAAAALFLLGGLALVLDVVAMYRLFTSRYPGANDFYSRWRGAQVYWQEGISPYSSEASLAIQEGLYGRPAQGKEDPGPFVYPFYTVFLLWPLVWLSYAWAEAIWLVLLQFAVIAGVLLCLPLVRWRLPGWLLVLTALWAVFFYHGARTIVLGQFAGLIFVWTVAALWCLRRQPRPSDTGAGILLALTTIKPQMSVLILPALVIWAVGQRRWRFLASGAVTLGILVGASFLLLPGWLGQFVRQVGAYPGYTATASPVWLITHLYVPALGTPGEIGLSVLLLLFLAWQWRRLPGTPARSDRFLWVIGLTLIVTNLVVVRTATTNYIVMVVPLFWLLKLAADRWPKWQWALALFYVISIAAIWALFLLSVQGDVEQPIMYLPLPLALLACLIAVGVLSPPVAPPLAEAH